MKCPKCEYPWLISDTDGEYYEDNNLVTKFIASCPKCGTAYTFETVQPIVETTMRNFKEME